MYQLNQSKNAVIAHFSKKIETDFPKEVKSISPDASMNTTDIPINNSHKIDSKYKEEVKSIYPVASMNTQTEIKHHLPTYQQVKKRMESYLKYPSQMGHNVFEWASEYSQRNHARMIVILSKLLSIEEDFYNEDFDVPEEDKKEIFKIGCDIDKEGGFQAQQACFYIAINFIEPNNNRTKAIEVCWNGAGSWRY